MDIKQERARIERLSEEAIDALTLLAQHAPPELVADALGKFGELFASMDLVNADIERRLLALEENAIERIKRLAEIQQYIRGNDGHYH